MFGLENNENEIVYFVVKVLVLPIAIILACKEKLNLSKELKK